MPFGFDGFFWWPMGIGIDWMIVVTEWVANLPGAASLAEAISRDEMSCVTEMAEGGFVAQALRGDALTDDCERAVPVVSARQPPRDCGVAVIDLARLRRQGALALWQNSDGFAVEAVRPRGSDRPWAPRHLARQMPTQRLCRSHFLRAVAMQRLRIPICRRTTGGR